MRSITTLKNNKIKGVIIALLMVFAVIGVTAQTQIQVSIANQEACSGDVLTVPVTIDTGFTGVMLWQLAISIDPQKINPGSITITDKHPAVDDANFIFNYNSVQQRLTASWYNFVSGVTVPAGANLFSISLEYAGGVADLTFIPTASFFNSSPGQTIPTTYIDGIISPLIEIIAQPQDVTVEPDNMAIFMVSTIPSAPLVNYQWQKLTNGIWTDLSDNEEYTGADTDQLIKENISIDDHGTLYRVVLERDGCVVISEHAVLNISELYQLTLVAEPEEGGAVSGGGWFTVGTEVLVVANPSVGFTFVEWTEGDNHVSGDTSFLFTMPSNDVTLTAIFDILTVEITAGAEPEGAGTIEGTGVYVFGEEVTLSAIPETGYNFIHWTENGEVVMDEEGTAGANYTFVAETDRHLTAHFALNEYTITATSGENGAIDPSGEVTVTHGETITFDFLPETGFQVEAVFVDGEVADVDNSYTFAEVTQNHTIHVDFSPVIFTIAATSSGGGSIDPAGDVEVLYGNNQTFTFHPDEGYYVESVIVDGLITDVQDEYTFVNVLQNHTIHVEFALFSYTLIYMAGENGSLAGDNEQVVEHGGDGTPVEAIADEGYLFDEWSDGVTDNPRTDTNVTANLEVTALFKPQSFFITATAGDGGLIDPEGDVEVLFGEDQSFAIIPDVGYHIADVLVDGTSVGATVSYTFSNVTTDHSIHADFSINVYTLSYSAGANGSLLGETEQQVAHGGDGTSVEAVPDEGYLFTKWSDGITDNPRTDTNVTGDIDVVAEFATDVYTLLYSAGANGSLLGETEQQVAHGGDGTAVEAVPGEGYHFTQWSDGVTDNPRTDTNVTGDIDVEAIFEQITYLITAEPNDASFGTVTGAGTYFHGEQVILEAIPAPVYQFVNWTEEDQVVSEEATYAFIAEQDRSLMANFALVGYTITFSVLDNEGDFVHDAVIVFDGIENEPGNYVFEEVYPGTYEYMVSAGCFLSYESTLDVVDMSMTVDVYLDTLPGDANGNGVVSVADIVVLANYVLGNNPEPFCFHNADVDGDGEITIADMVIIANIIAQGEMHPYPDLVSDDALMVLSKNQITIESDGTLTGVQFEITGTDLSNTILSLEIDSHQLVYETTEETILALIYSVDNEVIPVGAVDLVTIENIGEDFQWGEVLVVNINGDMVDVDYLTDDPTGLDNLSGDFWLQIYPNPATDIVYVNTPAEYMQLRLYNIYGGEVYSGEAGMQTYKLDVSGLKPGTYLLQVHTSKGQKTVRLLISR